MVCAGGDNAERTVGNVELAAVVACEVIKVGSVVGKMRCCCIEMHKTGSCCITKHKGRIVCGNALFVPAARARE